MLFRPLYNNIRALNLSQQIVGETPKFTRTWGRGTVQVTSWENITLPDIIGKFRSGVNWTCNNMKTFADLIISEELLAKLYCEEI